jgi:hypothetical protein
MGLQLPPCQAPIELARSLIEWALLGGRGPDTWASRWGRRCRGAPSISLVEPC